MLANLLKLDLRSSRVSRTQSSTKVPEVYPIISCTKVEPWTDLDELVKRCADKLQSAGHNPAEKEICVRINENIKQVNRYVEALSRGSSIRNIPESSARRLVHTISEMAMIALKLPSLTSRRADSAESEDPDAYLWMEELRITLDIIATKVDDKQKHEEGATVEHLSTPGKILDEGRTVEHPATQCCKDNVTEPTSRKELDKTAFVKNSAPRYMHPSKTRALIVDIALVDIHSHESRQDPMTSVESSQMEAVSSVSESEITATSIIEVKRPAVVFDDLIVSGKHASRVCQDLFDEVIEGRSEVNTLLRAVAQDCLLRSEDDGEHMKGQLSKVYQIEEVFAAQVAFLVYLLGKNKCTNVNWKKRAEFMNALGRAIGAKLPKSKRRPTDGPASGNSDNPVMLHDSASFHGANKTLNACTKKDSSSSVMPRLVGDPSAIPFARRTDAQTLHSVVDNHYGYLSNVGTHYVLQCYLGNVPVAVKFCQSLDHREGAEGLQHEKSVHELLYRRFGEKYGSFASKLVAYGDVPVYGLVIATLLVGLPVEQKNGETSVNGEQVEDVARLKEAAMFSLKQIHACGFSHGDIALRNMRAEKDERGSWHVWWIDFGFAFESNRTNFERETKQCCSLFE